jgi:diadenosine tetraphosphate (Ap4A) HIT family hydrolase
MTPHHIARAIFAHLPQATSKEAQASWKLAEKIARAMVAEGERVRRVTANADLPSTK